MIIHMHQKGFIYRDLKPENVLIDERGFVKLCDFGYCTKYEKEQVFKEVCGTLEYIPPELASGEGYDKTIDLYGLGIFLYELIAGKSPFEGITLENMREKKC
jgi:serine/threonine protein kinase